MHGLLKKLNFVGNPFEHLSAENEKEIDRFAVRPPYFEQTLSKAQGAKSFILFGKRGCGKSATRITVYKHLWNEHQNGKKIPLPVNFIDYDQILKNGLSNVNVRKFVEEACYKTIESILAWLTSLPEDYKNLYVEALSPEESEIILNMVKSFYLNRPERTRGLSAEFTLKLLDQAWPSRVGYWVEKRWSSIAKLISSLANGFARAQFGTNGEQTGTLFELLYSSENSDEQSTLIILSRLIEMTRIFGFDGICFLVDKVDETDKTSSSVEKSADLIFPLLSNIKLFEIDGISWTLFLWDEIRPLLLRQERYVRLDKLPNATIDWNIEELKELLESRLQHFSNKKHTFKTITSITDHEQMLNTVISLSTLSPRELVRLMDIVIREHNLKYTALDEIELLSEDSLNHGMNLFAIESSIHRYSEAMVRQIGKIRSTVFINRDIQNAFKIGDQSARSKIQKWMDSGAVKHSGYRPLEEGGPGRSFNEYTISDPRLARVITEGLLYNDDIPPDIIDDIEQE